jgi:hypothetical protein
VRQDSFIEKRETHLFCQVRKGKKKKKSTVGTGGVLWQRESAFFFSGDLKTYITPWEGQ